LIYFNLYRPTASIKLCVYAIRKYSPQPVNANMLLLFDHQYKYLTFCSL